MAYLVSQYPAANHTFILREILELRRLGFEIHVSSIRAADRPFERLSEDERREQRSTFYVKALGVFGVAGVNLRVFFTHPAVYLRALAYAVRLAGWNARTAVFNLIYFAEAAVVASWLRRQMLSHVHMHFTSTVGLFAQRLYPMQTSVTMHGPDEFGDPSGFYLSEKIRAFHLVVAISEFGRKQLMRYSDPGQWEKFRVVRLGVDQGLYAPPTFRGNPAPCEILFVGRLAPVKAAHILIAAVARLVHQGRSVRLRLVGDGPCRGELERGARERGVHEQVVFEGWQNADGVRAMYQQADIFCLPSLAEGIPVVLMEAMAMEIPCVATRVTGVPELIRDQIDGLLVASGNEEELAAALARLVDDSELRLRLGRSARQRVVQDFDLQRNTRQLAEVFREFEQEASRAAS